MKKIIALLMPLIIASFLMTAACSKKKLQTSDCVEKQMASDCICYKIYKPVCGCNGKTYENDCVARCHNIMQFTEGECPK